jgi:Transcriptional regulator
MADQLAEFLNEFQRETDRAAAVLAAAYLDSRLEALLRAKFVAVPKFVEELLTGQGGLSSFSARISVVYAVGLISLRAAEDLHIVRRIRNDFAHKLHGLSFNTPQIASYVSKFNILQALRNERGEAFPLPTDSRTRFNFAVAVLLLNAVEKPHS